MGCGASKDVREKKESTTISRMGQYVLEGAGENLRFSCWDFGGQDTFYSLHHLYMGRNSVYVLMFNMEWFLPERERDWSKHAFLAFWLCSIAAHAADPKDHSDMAPIILVGSHKDRMSSPKQHERISKLLCDTFQGLAELRERVCVELGVAKSTRSCLR
jgi:GTPase SAR1 family protein